MGKLALQSVDMALSDGRDAPGLVPVQMDALPERLDEASRVLEARTFKRIDYVFFRRFNDDRSSQVAAFVVDNSDQRLDKSSLARLHQQLWVHGAAPLLYVAWPTRVDVLSCARGPDFWENGRSCYLPAERIDIAHADPISTAGDIDIALTELKRRFSAFRLADGTFWDDPRNNHLAHHDKAAHHELIQAIVETDQDLEGANHPALRRLLVLTVLIKYLEDRSVFPPDWFGQFQTGAGSFFEVLRGENPQSVARLLTELRGKFNGDLFSLPQNIQLTRQTLSSFATLVEARTLKRQRYLWEQYAFAHLPVEVISRIYQRFVKGGRGAFYTPPMQASLLLDRAMPYDQLTGKERVLDPACGSGVFLVGAFKRLVNVWRSRNQWRPLNVEVLKSILKRSIFGAELHPGAIELAAFSLALAICDTLKPDVIWNELQFDPIEGSNLRPGDFFELVSKSKQPSNGPWPERFDVIIGNPPFESKLTEPGKNLNRLFKAERGKLPDNQAAYLFLEQGAKLLGEGGRLCLIQPSPLLYNRKAADFRRSILHRFRVTAVFDFTSIRNLFDGADPKTVAVLVLDGRPDPEGWVDHLTFRRTFSVSQKIGFELDHYDYNRVPQRLAESDPFVWRINLLGGGRLHEISRRVRSMRKLSEYVSEGGWDYGEGFVTATKDKRIPAPFLTGKPLLPTDALSDSGINEDMLSTVRDVLFRSPYTATRYSAPLILIKENATLPMAFWDKGFLAYRDSIVGIHAEPSDRESLYDFYRAFQRRRRFYQFCCALHGSKGMVGRATSILKQDIDALPIPKNESELDLSFWEDALVEDVLRYMTSFIRVGQNSELLRKRASPSDLKSYADMFCRMLGSVYENLKAQAPVDLNGLVCQLFCFGDHPEATWAYEGNREIMHDLIYKQDHESLQRVRIVRFYDKNTLLVVKPDRLRYWIRSTAIRDADDTLWDLRRRGY